MKTILRLSMILTFILVQTAVLLAQATTLSPADGGRSNSVTFNYTGSMQSWTVPAGVYSINIAASGAQGNSGDASGGYGGYAAGDLSVSPGQVIYIYVGGQNGYNGGGTGGLSQNGTYGGNGGGATDVRVGGTALGDRVIVAGGGGGGGRNGTWGGCQPSPAGAGGNGGGTAGSNGYSSSCNCGGGGAGGGVGTTNSGGAAGGYSGGCQQGGWCSGTAGSFGYGGNGSTCTHSSGSGGAGGGGGGYYGGGAGGNGSDTTPGGGGGGGASYTGGVSNGSATSGANSGNGYVQFTYTQNSGTVSFNYTGSIQTWTVPPGITSYTITAAGSRGGTAYNGSAYGYGGYGSTLQGTFSLIPGENIKIAVGGQGSQTGSTSTLGAGGGGGSFVWRENSTTEPLLAAGGGGGGLANGSNGYYGVAATITTNGTAATSGGAGGINGNGGAAVSSYGGGGGAGWKSDGGSNGAPGNDGGKSRASGFAGGSGYHAYGYNGGFGGGGGSTHGGGGGGGYSGGGGANNSTYGGGGGGSYNGGTNQSNTAGNNSGLGYVTISYDPMVSAIQLTGNLSSFSACQGAASASQIFSASGAGLTNNISINAPAGFEISLSENDGYSNILTLIQSGGTVPNTTVYVRITASATGNPSGNISLSSSGAATQYLAVSGTTSTASSGGTASATANSICSGTSTSISLSGYSGTIQWEQSANGNTGWASVSGGSGANSDNYTTALLNETTFYRARLSSGVCEDSYSDVEQISVANSWIGGVSGFWNIAENWCGGIPSAETSVSIPEGSSVTIPENAGASCNNLTINSGATLTVASGGSLITKGTVTGNITIQRTVTGSTDLTADAYHLVSVPLHPDNNSLSELFLGSYLYGYDPDENEWSPLGTSTSVELDETLGYMIFYPEASTTYSFTGQPNTGTFTPTVTYAGNSGSNNFALVPNPYPSNIDWNAASGWTKTNIGNTIWVYNNGNYATWNSSSGGANGGTQYIAVGQAFFVQTTGASPSLIMGNGVRTHNSATFLKNNVVPVNQLRVKALANNMQDEIIAGFAEGMSTNYDPMEDALKLYGAGDAPQLYTLAGNSKLSINQLADLNGSAEIPMHFETEFSGEIALEFSQMESFPADLKIRLEDKITGQWVNLRETSQYHFAHNPANTADRFVLHFGSAAGLGENENSNISSWFSGNTFYLSTPEYAGEKAKVEVFSVSGQLLFSREVTLSNLQQFNLNAKGAVITRVTLNNKVLNTKAIVL